MDKRPIGIFDSGLGGLSAVKAVLELLPNENIVILATRPACLTAPAAMKPLKICKKWI
jgi:glutamate racemase